jgi:hypothetical protein
MVSFVGAALEMFNGFTAGTAAEIGNVIGGQSLDALRAFQDYVQSFTKTLGSLYE